MVAALEDFYAKYEQNIQVFYNFFRRFAAVIV